MRLYKFLSIPMLCSILFMRNNVSCYSFHPISHANHQLFSFDRIPADKVRSDIHSVLKNFLTVKVKNLLKKLPEIKNTHSLDRLRSHDYAETLLEQANNLIQQSENKKRIANKIKQSYDRSIQEANKNNIEYSDKHKKILKQNFEQIEYLIKQAEQLKLKAEHLKEFVKEINKNKKINNNNNNKCSINKIGILKYVSSSNGLKHAIENVQVRIDEDGFSLYHKNEKKKTYLWNLIEIPIKVIGNVKQCFFFTYKNHNEIFCSKDKLDTFSWINVLSEGYFCHNFGMKSTGLNQTMNLQKLKNQYNKKNNKEILIVDIKPEENNTRVFINDFEQEIENSKEIDINKLKDNFEEERKSRNNETIEESKN